MKEELMRIGKIEDSKDLEVCLIELIEQARENLSYYDILEAYAQVYVDLKDTTNDLNEKYSQMNKE